jgi:polyphenol oxidase
LFGRPCAAAFGPARGRQCADRLFMHADWLIPDWPAPANVRAVFTTRQGGFSAVPYDSMNLGDHVGDRPENVQSNRAALQHATDTRAVFLKQVHGAEVLELAAGMPDAITADACVSTQTRLGCTIMVADCLPVLLTTEDGAMVGAAHAGWRGLAGVGQLQNKGVLEAVYESFSALAQQRRARSAIKIIAWLGPCIGPTAFEVGPEVKLAFEARHAEAQLFFAPATSGKFLADLAGLARLRLQSSGITQIYGNDGSEAWCTVSNPSKFFSHRRDAGEGGNGFGTTGRMAACVWLES